MDFDDMSKAVADARHTISAADSRVAAMADLIHGRLRVSGVSYSALRALKEELRKYNIHTLSWRK